jgi:phosphoglycolate phosphatase-like HAD superfamily hydrolase
MSGLRCIVFDLDGTLAQSNAIKRDAYYEVTRDLGEVSSVVDAVLAEVSGDRSAVLSEVVRRLQLGGLLPGDQDQASWVARLVAAYNVRCETLVASCPEVPGAARALGALKRRGFALYVNSATPLAPLERVLELRGLRALFSAVFGSEDGKAPNLRRVLELERAGPGAMLFVGDQEADRSAAEEVGCHFIAVDNEFSRFLRAPARRLPDLTGLEEAVLALDSGRLPDGGHP